MQPEELLDDETWALISSVLPKTQNSPKGGDSGFATGIVCWGSFGSC